MSFDRLSLTCFALWLGACAASSTPRTPPPANARVARPFAASPAGQGNGSHEADSPQSADASLSQTFSNARSLQTLSGKASYYSDRLAGHATASGAPYRPEAYTAAHRKLPLGTVLRITREDDGRVVYVRVNDRGPFTKHRILDLSRAAAERLGMLQSGVVSVRAEVVSYGPRRRR